MASWRIRLAAGVLALAMAAGCGPNVAPSRAAAGEAAVGTERAANSVPAPQSAEAAFVAGYHAYQARNYAAATRELGIAAAGYPALRDYALFFLASSQSGAGASREALATFQKLVDGYPESVFFDSARLQIAELELTTGNPSAAKNTAAALVASAPGASIAAGARTVIANALAAEGDFRGAYHEFEEVRIRFPLGPYDGKARDGAYAILREHPELTDTHSEEYLEAEAAQLMREGQHRAALKRVEAALALGPERPVRARLVWLKAEALRSFARHREKAALHEYLALAPSGPAATRALDQLGHLYWNDNDTEPARAFFTRLARDFPRSRLAPEAVYSIGRTYEDDGKPDLALSEYERVLARYPTSRAAHDARFRAPWMLYMTGRYASAARVFGREAMQAGQARDRDRFRYWQARALENQGDGRAARVIFAALAARVDTNYYPALAELKVAARPSQFPAALAPDPSPIAPPTVSGAASFHLNRSLVLARLRLPDLEVMELSRLETESVSQPELRGFVLARFQAAGAWYAAIEAAARMAKRDEINRYTAERVRYPRAFHSLVNAAARREDLAPDLLLALMRQESLFNPKARSRTDAKGLMQLEAATARKAAARGGLRDSVLDLYEPALNVKLGAAWLKHLLLTFDGDRFKAVAAYNAGQDAVKRWATKFPGADDEWVENIGYRETRNYVKQVIGGMREYRLLYGAARPPSLAAAGRSEAIGASACGDAGVSARRR